MTVSTATPRTVASPATLAGQVRQVQEHYPELYRYLTVRDQKIERALKRIPSHADIELSGVFDTHGYLAVTLRDLQPGIEGLVARTAAEMELNEDEVIHG